MPWWLAGGFGLVALVLLIWLVHNTLLEVVVLPLLLVGLRAGFTYRRRSRNQDPH